MMLLYKVKKKKNSALFCSPSLHFHLRVKVRLSKLGEEEEESMKKLNTLPSLKEGDPSKMSPS